MALAPSSVQRMPDCCRRAPPTFLRLASMTPEPICKPVHGACRSACVRGRAGCSRRIGVPSRSAQCLEQAVQSALFQVGAAGLGPRPDLRRAAGRPSRDHLRLARPATSPGRIGTPVPSTARSMVGPPRTARRGTCRRSPRRALRRRCVSHDSKSSGSAAPGAANRAIPSSMAEANCCAQAYILAPPFM